MSSNEFENPEVYFPPGSSNDSNVLLLSGADEATTSTVPAQASSATQSHQTPRRGSPSKPVLTIDAGDEVDTRNTRDDIIWHEIQHAYLTKRILSGMLTGVEQLDNRKTIAVVDFKGLRILIPLKEMMILLDNPSGKQHHGDTILRQVKLLGNMLGCEIDFLIRGIDSATRAIVASRREAVLRKRQKFYFEPNADGNPHIQPGRVVQARVIAVSEKSIRVEVFGVECPIVARDLAWQWIGDAHDNYSVGDKILVRVQTIQGDTPEDLKITADVRSISQDTSRNNLEKIRVQSRYAGKVTDVRKGVVYIRLNNGVNAIAHSCYDYRMPGKKDDVSFAVTKLDREQGVAVGIITRIIRQNL